MCGGGLVIRENDVQFNLTNNPWINNGLVRLALEIDIFSDDVAVDFTENKITFMDVKAEKILKNVEKVINDLATQGTYNFNSNLKILKKYTNSSYSSPKNFPTEKKDKKKKIKIPKKERDLVEKEMQNVNLSSKEKIWKQRSSYIGSRTNKYFDIGLNFESQRLYDLFKENITDKNIKDNCPICGSPSRKLISKLKMQQSINPLAGEHHNNVVEEYSHSKNSFTSADIRKKIRGCPKCVLASHISLFDYYIPFFISSRTTSLALPLTQNLEVLKKTINNLSIRNQFIDFSDPGVTSYWTNIKNLPSPSISAAVLALLHNIKNEYREKKLDSNKVFFEVIEEDFVGLTDWILFTNDSSFYRIKSSEKIYDLFEQHEIDGEKVYFLTDLLGNFKLNNLPDYTIENFYNSILTLDIEKFTKTMFLISKKYMDDKSILFGKLLRAFKLWNKIYLDKIFKEVIKMDDEIKEACRDIAKSVGKNFSEDVSILTKFAYASGPDEFKEALEDANFRLAKQSIDKKVSQIFVNEGSLSLLYEALEEKKYFDDLKNYFVSFMSVNVISSNYTPKGDNE